MRRFFDIYQYVFPVLFFPLAYWLWWLRYENHQQVLFALIIPITFSYVVPAFGTNWLKIWEFNTRFRMGRFRPQHGFLFGTASSLFALICLPLTEDSISWWEIIRSGFVVGSVVAFWNWYYDMQAIKNEFVFVYNRAWFEGRDAATISAAYSPVFFGSFGFCYGVSIRLSEYLVTLGHAEWIWSLMIGSLIVSIPLPVLLLIAWTYCTIGESGLKSYQGEKNV